MTHLYVFSQLALMASFLLHFQKGAAFGLFIAAAAYHLIDAFLFRKLKIRLHPSLLPLLFRPASFLSSFRKLNPLPLFLGLSLFFVGIGFALPPFLFLLSAVSPHFFLALFFASGIVCALETKPLFTNPLFLIQADAAIALKNRWKRKEALQIPSFPNEKSHFLSKEYPLLRLTSEHKGKKIAEISLKKGEKPHLIFLILESFRAKNIGSLGAKIPLSPRFDALAEKGILYTRFHSAGNLTNRCSIASLYGTLPAYRAWHMGRYVPIPLIGLPQILSQFGYHPALIQGSSLAFDHGIEFFQGHGFQTLLGKRDIEKRMRCDGTSWGVFDEHLLSFSASWLEQQRTPAFLTLFSITNHHPWTSPKDWLCAHEHPYFKTFSYTDWALGSFIDELEKKGILENSLLFIFGDHGQEMTDRDPNFEINCHLYQENIHVPLLIYGKGRIQRPQRIDTLSSQVDLLPTVLDLLQIPGPHHSTGSSLLRAHSKPIFFSYPFDPPIRGCREENWKWLHSNGEDQLYDLENDPEEKHNCALTQPKKTEHLKNLSSAHASLIDRLYETQKFAPPFQSGQSGQSGQTSKNVPSFHLALHLDFSDSLRMTDELLIETARNCPDLSSLSLSRCVLITDQGISALLELCPHLEKLNLEGLDDITGENWPPAPHLMHFKALECPRLKPALWFKSLSSLRIVQIGSYAMTDEDLFALSLTGPLMMLQLSGLTNATDQGLAQLLSANPHLETLFLEDCPQIGDASLAALNGRLLSHLFLSDCPQIGDSALSRLDSFPLRYLVLRNCSGITPEGLGPLKNKPGLEILALNCPHLPHSMREEPF